MRLYQILPALAVVATSAACQAPDAGCLLAAPGAACAAATAPADGGASDAEAGSKPGDSCDGEPCVDGGLDAAHDAPVGPDAADDGDAGSGGALPIVVTTCAGSVPPCPSGYGLTKPGSLSPAACGSAGCGNPSPQNICTLETILSVSSSCEMAVSCNGTTTKLVATIPACECAGGVYYVCVP